MGLFRMELYKILRRKVLWGFGAVFLLFAGLWLSSWVLETDTVADGVRYTGLEAIQKDREIARQWEGTLTMETLYEIVDTYGFAVREGTEEGALRTGNWVSRFATDELTDYRQREDQTSVQLLDEEQLSNLQRRLETYAPYFCYMDQADFLLEAAMTVNVLVLLLVCIGLAPVFTEEYQLRTAPVLQVCAGGREALWRAKLLAAAAFAEGLYVLADGLLLGGFLLVYGADGLFAGASLLGAAGFWHEGSAVWQVCLLNFFWGMLGIFVMTVTALFLSAACRHMVPAFGGGLAFLASGYAALRVLPQLLPLLPLRVLCRIYGEYSPIYLVAAAGNGSILKNWQHLALLGAGIFLSVFWMRRSWNRAAA